MFCPCPNLPDIQKQDRHRKTLQLTLETHVAVNAQCVLLLINFVSFPGSVGPGSAAVAVAAHQAVTTTLGMQSGRRGSGALKPPYAAALGELIWN